MFLIRNFIRSSFSIRFVTSASVVVASATVTQSRAILPIPKTLTNSYVAVSTTLADPSVKDVVRDSFKKLGDSRKPTILSLVKVTFD